MRVPSRCTGPLALDTLAATTLCAPNHATALNDQCTHSQANWALTGRQSASRSRKRLTRSFHRSKPFVARFCSQIGGHPRSCQRGTHQLLPRSSHRLDAAVVEAVVAACPIVPDRDCPSQSPRQSSVEVKLAKPHSVPDYRHQVRSLRATKRAKLRPPSESTKSRSTVGTAVVLRAW